MNIRFLVGFKETIGVIQESPIATLLTSPIVSLLCYLPGTPLFLATAPSLLWGGLPPPHPPTSEVVEETTYQRTHLATVQERTWDSSWAKRALPGALSTGTRLESCGWGLRAVRVLSVAEKTSRETNTDMRHKEGPISDGGLVPGAPLSCSFLRSILQVSEAPLLPG